MVGITLPFFILGMVKFDPIGRYQLNKIAIEISSFQLPGIRDKYPFVSYGNSFHFHILNKKSP